MKKFIRWVLISVITLVLLSPLIFIIYLFAGIMWGLQPKVNPKRYAKVLPHYAQHSDHYSFLPSEIPENAEKVGFLYVPGFGQGGTVFALRLTLPPESVISILKELESSHRKEVSASDLEGVGVIADQVLPAYDRKNSDHQLSTLPDGFRMFLHDTDLEDIKKNWNHNTFAFTAVSTGTNEVLYYTDRW